jgi:hypothetical protein
VSSLPRRHFWVIWMFCAEIWSMCFSSIRLPMMFSPLKRKSAIMPPALPLSSPTSAISACTAVALPGSLSRGHADSAVLSARPAVSVKRFEPDVGVVSSDVRSSAVLAKLMAVGRVAPGVGVVSSMVRSNAVMADELLGALEVSRPHWDRWSSSSCPFPPVTHV